MSVSSHRWWGALGAFGLVASTVASAGAASADPAKHDGRRDRHVLLLSVDGLHQSDLDWYVAHHRRSALAALVGRGVSFTNAQTPVPSDSFPGMVAQVTGGNPKTTGVYYDDSWNNALLPAGTTDCTAAAPGAEVTYFEQLDKDLHALDAGQGLSGLPGSILQMTANPRTLIDPAQLPVDPATCLPVYPHSYLRVNTIFEVARAAGLRTAWSDKHAAYEILNGPSGAGIQDLFTPEINSDAPTYGAPIDWTKDNALTQRYDGFKVQAVVNEIGGFDHSGTTKVGTPSIFGMNFQSVSTAEKLPSSGGRPGGYLADGRTPGPVLADALDFIDASVATFQRAIHAAGIDRSTTVVLSAKHGQSPMDAASLTRISDGKIIDALDARWNAEGHPGTLVNFSIADDAMLLWLSDHSTAAKQFATSFLLGFSGTDATDIAGKPKSYTGAGLSDVIDGATYFATTGADERVPDLFGVAQHGVVYTKGKGKISEHGGSDPQDRHVPIVVSGAGVAHHAVSDDRVETTQIAPTILELLHLDPEALQAVRLEGTDSLPLD